MRELMPVTPFLLPGIGAQGGRVEDVAPAFAPGRAGGLITASRSIVGARDRPEYAGAAGPGGRPGRAGAARRRVGAGALTAIVRRGPRRAAHTVLRTAPPPFPRPILLTLMRTRRRSITARILAPLALIAAGFAVWAVVQGGGLDSVTKDSTTTTATTKAKAKKVKAKYTVRSGDVLGAIAVKYGVSIERIRELNPDLDPNALRAGEVIRLRR